MVQRQHPKSGGKLFMADTSHIHRAHATHSKSAIPTGAPCIMLIFGATGDLTKRLLVPALYNLACDGLLPDNFAVLGTGRTQLTTETFREHMSSAEQGIRKFHTRKTFDEAIWDKLVSRFSRNAHTQCIQLDKTTVN
jgi:hypothetical protein